MYTEKELRTILENWDIEKNLPVSDVYLSNGSKVSGNIWSVGSDYFLKTGKRELLLKKIKISKEFHRQGFSSLPILTKTGEEYVDGKDIFILTRGFAGSPLPKSDRFGDNRVKFGEKYGKGIARH